MRGRSPNVEIRQHTASHKQTARVAALLRASRYVQSVEEGLERIGGRRRAGHRRLIDGDAAWTLLGKPQDMRRLGGPGSALRIQPRWSRQHCCPWQSCRRLRDRPPCQLFEGRRTPRPNPTLGLRRTGCRGMRQSEGSAARLATCHVHGHRLGTKRKLPHRAIRLARQQRRHAVAPDRNFAPVEGGVARCQGGGDQDRRCHEAWT
jgi:hypothetical protein